MLHEAESNEETKKLCYVSGLAERLGKAKSEMSDRLKELEGTGLVEHEQREGERRKYYKLSSKGKRIIGAIIDATEEKPAEKPVKLEEPEPETLEFILQKLNKASTDEARTAVLEDFSKLCHRTRIWKFGNKVWPVIRKHLSIESKDSAKFLGCLKGVIENMFKLGEEKEIQELKRVFFKEIEEAYKKSISPELLAFQEVASFILKMLGSEDEKIRIYKDALENIIKREDVKSFSDVGGIAYIDALLDFKLSKAEKMDLREWLYTLMENENETARKKALYVYEVTTSRL